MPLDPTTLGITLREPYGVIAVIVPYNMPIAMLSNKVGGALAAGNTVVVKPPEQASVGILRFAELVEGDPAARRRSTSSPGWATSATRWSATSTSARSR